MLPARKEAQPLAVRRQLSAHCERVPTMHSDSHSRLPPLLWAQAARHRLGVARPLVANVT